MGTNETNENVTNTATNAADETVANAPAPKKNHGGAWKAVLAVVLTAGVVGSTTLSAFNLATLKSYVASQQEDQNEETTEDYVKIAEQYEIKPTTNISDAYKSGDTSKLTDKEKETLDMAKDALKEMTRDPLIYSAFGEHTYNKYLEAKQKEWDSYRSLITPWEIENYLVK